MSAAVLDSHPTLTAVLFGLYEQEPGVFSPISFEDRLTAVQILADRLDPPAPDPHLATYEHWFIPGGSPHIQKYVRSFTILEEVHFNENWEESCGDSPSPGPSSTAASTTGFCVHGISLAFRCGHCFLEGKRK